MEAYHEELSREIAGLKAALEDSARTAQQGLDGLTAMINSNRGECIRAFADIRRNTDGRIATDVATLQSQMRGISGLVQQSRTDSLNCLSGFQDVQFSNRVMATCLASMAACTTFHGAIEPLPGGHLIVQPSAQDSGVIGHFRKTDSLFTSGCTLRQSSGDVFCLIDPDSQDVYESGSSGQAWIRIELRDPLIIHAIRIQAANGHFPCDFRISFTGPAGALNRPVRGANLAAPFQSETYSVGPLSITAVTITQSGPAWDGQQRVRFKSLELFAPAGLYSHGFFRALFNAHRDRIHQLISITARDYDLSDIHSLTPRTTVCIFGSAQAWVEVAFDNHRLLVNSYRLDRNGPRRLRSWRLVGTNDNSLPLAQWTTIDSRREATQGQIRLLECYPCLGGPFRYFRIVQQEPNWDNNLILRFKHFELFGALIPIE
jgi:hypothetical protein